jgi:hypothetical protein
MLSPLWWLPLTVAAAAPYPLWRGARRLQDEAAGRGVDCGADGGSAATASLGAARAFSPVGAARGDFPVGAATLSSRTMESSELAIRYLSVMVLPR